jgi:hypothetical protein
LKMKNSLFVQRNAAVCIQSCARRYICQARFNTNQQRVAALICCCTFLKSVIRIQSFARMVIASQRFLVQCNASARILRCYRMFRGRKRLRTCLTEKKKNAATQIQKIFRGWKCRTDYLFYLKAIYDIIACQSIVRKYLARKRYVETISDVITCQSIARTYLACKRRDTLLQMKSVMDVVTQEEAFVSTTPSVSNENHQIPQSSHAEIQYHVIEEEGFANYLLNINVCDEQMTHRQTIKRRYREFYSFNKQLRSQFDAKTNNLPLIPPRTWCRNISDGFVERRAMQLNVYLKMLAMNPAIVNSQLYKSFLGKM